MEESTNEYQYGFIIPQYPMHSEKVSFSFLGVVIPFHQQHYDTYLLFAFFPSGTLIQNNKYQGVSSEM
jgi:hypothetical protein